MTRISLEQGFYQSRSFIANAQRCLNLYPEAGTSDGPSPTTCYPTPGLTLVGSGTPDAPVRCLYTASNGVLFAVIGNQVGDFNSQFHWTQFGTLPTSSGPCYMKDNGIDVVLVDESTFGYSWALNNYSAFAQINDPTGLFVGSVNVEFLDSYFLFSVPNTAQFYSSLSNSLTFDPLYIVSKNGSPDFVAFLAVCQRYIWVLGTKTTELWYDAGAATFPFGEVQGTFFQHGCAAPASVAVSDTHVWWLGQDAQGQGIVYNGSGAQVTRISTHAIEQVIQSFIEISDAIGMTYQQQGHNFYVLTFPSADRTFVWDDATQLWHERCWLDSNGFEHRHRANCMANAYGKVVCGDWQNGNLYALDLNNYTDNGAPIKRVRGFPHLPTSYDPKTGLSHLEGKRIRYDQFIADIEAGGTPETSLFTALGAPVIVSVPGLTIGFTNPPTSAITGSNVTFNGTVYTPGSAVQVAFGTSPTNPPTTGWFNAIVTSGTWTIQLTAPAVGNYYVWARQTNNTQITAETPFQSLINAPQIVQHVAASANSPNITPVQTLTLTLPNPVTIGNMLIFSNTGGYPQYGDNGGGNDPPTGFTAAATSAGLDNTWFTNMSFKTATSTISPSITIQNAPPGTHFSSQAGILMEVNGENFSFHAGSPDATYNSISGNLLISSAFGTIESTESLFWNLFTAEGNGTFGLVGPVGGTILSTINGVSIFEGSNYVGADIAWNSTNPESSTVSSNANLTITSPPFIGFQSWGRT